MPSLYQEVISFLDKHHINYKIKNGNLYLHKYSKMKITYSNDTLHIYEYNYNNYILHSGTCDFEWFVYIIYTYIFKYPYIIELKCKLSIFENEYKSITNTKNIKYPTKILADQVTYMEGIINELYTPNGNLSLYYEQLFYSIID